MRDHLLTIAAVSMTVFAAMPGTAVSGEAQPVKAAFVEDIGAQERINYSGKLRMLSQRIPAAACHLAKDIDPEGARALLQDATGEFEKILSGLEFGDEDLNIRGEEPRRKTVARIHELRAAWLPVQSAADAILAGDMSQENVDVILKENLTLLDIAQVLVSDLVAQYSDPASMLQSHSMLIDISGRQRMLTQKISKESCMIAAGWGTEETPGQLRQTMDMYEVSLSALIKGMPDAGIAPPPNAEIAAGLALVYDHWNEIKPTIEAELSGASVDSDADTVKFRELNAAMSDMSKLVTMYTEAVKMGL